MGIGVLFLLWTYFGNDEFAKSTGLDSNDFPLWFHDLGQLGAGFGIPLLVQLLALVAGYALSLDRRARRRPWVAMSLGAFGVGLTIGGAYMAETHQELTFTENLPNTLGVAVACGIIASAAILAFELFNRFFWTTLLKRLDKQNMGGAALTISQMALLWAPGQKGLLRSVTIELYRKGSRGEVTTHLREMYASGDRGHDLLEVLCQLANEEKQPMEFLGYLRELHTQFPDDRQISDTLLEELLEQGHHSEALDLMEKHGVEGDAASLERYGLLLAEAGRLPAAVEAAKRLGEVEGIPMRRSEALLRRVLSKDESQLDAVNLLADQAERMARRDQEIRWLEKSLLIDSRQDTRRWKLVELLEEAEQTGRVEAHLAELARLDPNNEPLGVRYAQVMMENGRVAEAVTHLEMMFERGIESGGVLELLARGYCEADRYADARRVSDEAMKRTTLTEKQRESINQVRRRIERAEFSAELAELLERCVAEPTNTDLWLDTLRRLCRSGHSERAVAHADNLMGRDPALRHRVALTIEEAVREAEDVGFPILNLLADLQAAENRYDDAIETVQRMAARSITPEKVMKEGAQKILRRSPHHLRTLRMLGELHRDQGQFTEMIHAFSLYLSNGGEEDEQLDLSLANAYMALNDYASARRFVQSLLEGEATTDEKLDRNRDLIRRIIPMAISAGKAEDAADFLKQLEAISKADKEIRALREEVNESMGRQRFTFLKRELESGKGDRKALEELGDICLEQDDFNQAITYYQRAARQSGNTRVPATKLAYCFAKKRMFDLAGETLGDLRLSLDDNDEDLEEMMVWIYKTAEVLEEARMFERASKLFKQLMKIDAGYKDVITRVEKLGRM
jgi:predicted Zn-dependent protease